MKLHDCLLTVDEVVSASPILNKPHPIWVEACRSGDIPESLYRFYCLAQYFSLYRAPKFLADDKNILFRYLGSVVEGIKNNLMTSKKNVDELKSLSGKKYSPIKKLLRISYEKDASEKMNGEFKDFIISMYACLDLFAEVVAIILYKEKSNVKVGKAEFSRLYESLEKELPNKTGIVEPNAYYYEELHKELRPYFISDKSDCEWFKLFRLYRHKIIHMGTSILRLVALHDKKGEFYDFLPNRWPYLFEEEISMSERDKNYRTTDMSNYFETNLIHEDVNSYVANLYQRIFDVLSTGFNVLTEAYKNLNNTPARQACFDELIHNSEKYHFKMFR